MITTARYGLTLCLLAIVWFNAHWSVALSLSLLAIANELTAYNRARRYSVWRNRGI
jgi:hypothetical protein